MLKAYTYAIYGLMALSTLLSAPSALAVERLDLATVLKKIEQHYPSLQIAAKQVTRAQQDVIAARSQLGWNLSATAGVSHDVSLLGTGIADTTSMSLSVSKQLSNGDSLSVGTNINDQKYNPSQFGLDSNQAQDLVANYRMPFGKGNGNPAYQLSINNSKAGVMMSEASERSTRDQIGNQVIELFYGAAQAREALQNASDGLERAEKLVKYIKNNMRLGLAEEKDYLQYDAQQRAAQVDLKNAELMWRSQRSALNRLMGAPWDQDFVPVVQDLGNSQVPEYQSVLNQSKDYNPDLLRYKAQLMMAEAAIDKARNDRENKLDLVMSVGNKSRDLNNSGSPTSDMSYSLQVEYGMPLSKSGFDAKLYQAQIDKGIAQDNLHQSEQDLQYNINSSLNEIQTSRQALELSKQRLQVEQQRYDDVKQRFKSGRVDNSQLIMAQGNLSQGEFNLKQRQIDLAKRQAKLNAMRGILWQSQP